MCTETTNMQSCTVLVFWLISSEVIMMVVMSPLENNPQPTPLHRAKRIAFGETVPSMDIYKTYYFVSIRRTWACIADQTDHEGSLTRCQRDHNSCGGTLIHPEFVLTAAHCIMYYEVSLTTGGELLHKWIEQKTEDNSGSIWGTANEAWETFEQWVVGLFVMPKPKFVVYSDWALLMGSHELDRMTQKRHVAKVFPHSKFPLRLSSEEEKEVFRESLNEWHDVSLLRTCQAFNIKRYEVEIAPRLSTLAELREQYQRIVERGLMCLYVGMGKQFPGENVTEIKGHPVYPRNFLLHTWRSSKCSSSCNARQAVPSNQHTCFLCSWHHGSNLGVAQKGDSGSPVTCEHRFVSVLTKGRLRSERNYTSTGSYPLHCFFKAITSERLEYYKTVKDSEYHPLLLTKIRRVSLSSD